MATFTLDDLQAALGSGFTLERFGDDQANVSYGGGSVGFIGLEDNLIEAEIRVTGYGLDESVDEEEAQAVSEELRDVWNTAGFTVSDGGSLGEHWHKDDPNYSAHRNGPACAHRNGPRGLGWP